jgi:hypothetical protein
MDRGGERWKTVALFRATGKSLGYWAEVTYGRVRKEETNQGRYASRGQSGHFAHSLCITSMMEAVHTPEILVYFNKTTRHYIPESRHLQVWSWLPQIWDKSHNHTHIPKRSKYKNWWFLFESVPQVPNIINTKLPSLHFTITTKTLGLSAPWTVQEIDVLSKCHKMAC